MSTKKISYLSRDFDDYRKSLMSYTQEYYPEIYKDLNDASIGSWLIDLMAAMGDNLGYYIDRSYNETNVESAQQMSSIMSLARSNGLKVPGPKGAITELKFTCRINTENGGNSSSQLGAPSWDYAPVIKRGARVRGSNNQYFETIEDIDFTEQFNEAGESNREIIPVTNSNGSVVYYEVSKTCMAVAGISKIYKLTVNSSMVKPFMDVIIPDLGVMNIESIILKDGSTYQTEPCSDEFMIPVEHYTTDGDDSKLHEIYRFFEVDSLSDSYMWGDAVEDIEAEASTVPTPVTVKYSYSGSTEPTFAVTQGQWIPVKQKFVTEYTDKGYMRIIFGGGSEVGKDVNIDNASSFAKAQITRMVNNDFLGRIPKAGMTMFIKYRVGGGFSSNVAEGTINTIQYMDASNKTAPTTQYLRGASAIIESIRVTNTIPSVAGKDMPNVEEIRAMIKYANASQNRCITVKDYENRVLQMPSRYGCPFRVSVTEENNKIMIFLMMVNHLGKLTGDIPSVVAENIANYLSKFRCMNDYVEIKSGKVINLQFEMDVYVDKKYNVADVVANVISTVKDYMDINRRQMGEDVYVSDIEKEISQVDGIINLISMRVYNVYGGTYSSHRTTQQTINVTVSESADDSYSGLDEIDLEASDYILNTERDEMFEIKKPNEGDIKVRVLSK